MHLGASSSASGFPSPREQFIAIKASSPSDPVYPGDTVVVKSGADRYALLQAPLELNHRWALLCYAPRAVTASGWCRPVPGRPCAHAVGTGKMCRLLVISYNTTYTGLVCDQSVPISNGARLVYTGAGLWSSQSRPDKLRLRAATHLAADA